MKEWQKTTLAAIIGFLVGLGIGWLGFARESVLPTDEDTEPVTETGGDSEIAGEELEENDRREVSGVFVEEELVEVKDQQAGRAVFVTRVALEAPGWVAIHENHGGLPGTVLGAHRFDVGVYQGTVTLLRSTEAGKRYHAVLWRDNGDAAFDLESDTVVSGVAPMIFEAY